MFQRRAVILSPDIALLSLMHALTATRLGRAAGIERGLDRVIMIEPANIRFRHIVAEVSGSLDNPYWARGKARAALIMDPAVASGYGALATSENALLRHQAALWAARATVTLTPGDERAWDYFLQIAGPSDAAAAARVATTHMRIDFTTPEPAMRLLHTLREAGQLADARRRIDVYRRTLKSGGGAGLWAALAELDHDESRNDPAASNARRAEVLAPGAPSWIGLCYRLAADDRDARVSELRKLFVTNAPGIGDVYRALTRPGLRDRKSNIQDALRVAAGGGNGELARKCVFLAGILGDADDLPFESADQRARLDDRLRGELAIYATEIRAQYVHKAGRFIRPLPGIDSSRVAADALADTRPDGLTFLVPTGNRLSDVTAVVRSYLPAIAQGTEFVFSVFADREGTAAYLRRQFGDFPNVRIHETAAAYFSKAAAINAAGQLATQRYLVLLDCDCRLARADAAVIAASRLRREPNAIHSFGYRGMIGLRHALFADMGMLPEFLIDAQLALAAAPTKGRVETDDFVLICEFLLRYQSTYHFWGNTRYERVDLGNACWAAQMRPAANEYEAIIYHYGEYRAARRSDRYTFLNDPDMYRDEYLRRGDSLRIDPFMTKMRRYVERQAACRSRIDPMVE